jgi:hypothetical protein
VHAALPGEGKERGKESEENEREQERAGEGGPPV